MYRQEWIVCGKYLDVKLRYIQSHVLLSLCIAYPYTNYLLSCNDGIFVLSCLCFCKLKATVQSILPFKMVTGTFLSNRGRKTSGGSLTRSATPGLWLEVPFHC